MTEAKSYPLTTTDAATQAAEAKRCFDAALQLATGEVVFMDDELKNNPKVKATTNIIRRILNSTTRELALEKATEGAGETASSLERLDKSQIDAVMKVWDKQETIRENQRKADAESQKAEAIQVKQAMAHLQPRQDEVITALHAQRAELTTEFLKLGPEDVKANYAFMAYRRVAPELNALFTTVVEAIDAANLPQNQADLDMYREERSRTLEQIWGLEAIQNSEAPHIGERWGKVLAAIDRHPSIGKSRGDAIVQGLLAGNTNVDLAVLDEKKLAPGLGGTGLFAGKTRKTIIALRQKVAFLARELTALPDSVKAVVIQNPQADYSSYIAGLTQEWADFDSKVGAIEDAFRTCCATVELASYTFQQINQDMPCSQASGFEEIFSPIQAAFIKSVEADGRPAIENLYRQWVPLPREILLTPELSQGLADTAYVGKLQRAIEKERLRADQLGREREEHGKLLKAIDLLGNNLSHPVTSYADLAARRQQIEQAEKFVELLNAPQTPAAPATPWVYRTRQGGTTLTVDFRGTPLLGNG